jgi:hypothetical protein
MQTLCWFETRWSIRPSGCGAFDCHRCCKRERLFRAATAKRAVQLRQHHGLHCGRAALGHRDQYGLRDNRRAVAVPGIGAVHRTDGTLDVAQTPAGDCIDPGLQLASVRFCEASPPIRRKVLADFQTRARNNPSCLRGWLGIIRSSQSNIYSPAGHGIDFAAFEGARPG